MKKLFDKLNIEIPYLYDKTQEVAKSLMAECTPEFYLFDKTRSLIYRGRLDSSSPDVGERYPPPRTEAATGRWSS